MHRAALVAPSAVGGAIVAMIVDVMLTRRGIGLVGAWHGSAPAGATPVRAAIASIVR